MLSVPKPLVFTMLVAAQGGPPASMDGNALLSLCQVGNDEERVCMVYIEAVADEWRFINFLTDPHKPFCAADALSTQLRDAVLSYIKAHPEERTASAAELITSGITEAWHCKWPVLLP